MSEKLQRQSERFHAFEWVRAEALKCNKHAVVLGLRLSDIESQLKEAVDLLAVTPRFTIYGCEGVDLFEWLQRRDTLLAKIKEGR